MSAGITVSGVVAGCLLAICCSIWLASAGRSLYLDGNIPQLVPAAGALLTLVGLVWETNGPGSLWSLSIPLFGWEMNSLVLAGLVILLLGAAMTSVVEYLPARKHPRPESDHSAAGRDVF